MKVSIKNVRIAIADRYKKRSKTVWKQAVLLLIQSFAYSLGFIKALATEPENQWSVLEQI